MRNLILQKLRKLNEVGLLASTELEMPKYTWIILLESSEDEQISNLVWILLADALPKIFAKMLCQNCSM